VAVRLFGKTRLIDNRSWSVWKRRKDADHDVQCKTAPGDRYQANIHYVAGDRRRDLLEQSAYCREKWCRS
jgi:hypothetical protein